jgi:hypothetical protein
MEKKNSFLKRHRTVIGFFLYIFLLIISSSVITFNTFNGVQTVKESFLQSLLTVDSIFIAFVGLVIPIIFKALNVEETLKLFRELPSLSLDTTDFPPDTQKTLKEFNKMMPTVSRILVTFITSITLLSPLAAVLPFVFSIFATLSALLREGSESIAWAAWGFFFSVFGFALFGFTVLLIVIILWLSALLSAAKELRSNETPTT